MTKEEKLTRVNFLNQNNTIFAKLSTVIALCYQMGANDVAKELDKKEKNIDWGKVRKERDEKEKTTLGDIPDEDLSLETKAIKKFFGDDIGVINNKK